MALYQGGIARKVIGLFNGPLACQWFLYD